MLDIPDDWQSSETTTLDFIIVGGGAGGCPLAARLAERGYTVLVLEMGPATPLPDEMLTSVIRLLRDNPADLEIVHRLLHSARGGLESLGASLKRGSRVSLLDESGEVEITKVDHAQQVRAWDLEGKLLFEGPCNTPADHEAIPEALRSRVERLLLECRPPNERRPALSAPAKMLPLPSPPAE